MMQSVSASPSLNLESVTMLQRLDAHLPVRYSFMVLCAFGALLALFSLVAFGVGWLALILCLALVGVGVRDLRQTRHAILRNYPVIGHMRFLFEFIRPEMRQYFIESDSEATPFSRAQRSLVYQRSKGEPDNQPFGTHLDVGAQGYEWVNHSMAPTKLPTHARKRMYSLCSRSPQYCFCIDCMLTIIIEREV